MKGDPSPSPQRITRVIETLKREEIDAKPIDRNAYRQIIYSIFAKEHGWTPEQVDKLYEDDVTIQLRIIGEKYARIQNNV